MAHQDQLSRALRDLRISVTDRCNFRCIYCMPRESFSSDHHFLARSQLLSYEEIERVARIFVGLGVRKIRLTGGEPLVRRDLPRLVRLLADLRGLEDLALTTNGVLLGAQAAALREAGLRRVTVSLDSVDEETFRTLSASEIPLARVLEGIDIAIAEGLTPLKVNAVIRRGINDGEVEQLTRHFHGTGVTLRFIEYMDVGNTNHWASDDVVSADEILERVQRVFPIEAIAQPEAGRVAERFRYKDGGGEIGVIASVTRPFCSGCTRVRLSPEGQLFTCLFAAEGFDLRGPLRSGAGDERLRELIFARWASRHDRYSEQRQDGGDAGPKIEMSRIGG